MTAHVDDSGPQLTLKNEAFAYVKLESDIYPSTLRRGKVSGPGKYTCLAISSVTLRYHPVMIFVAKEYSTANLKDAALKKKQCELNVITNHEVIHYKFLNNLDMQLAAKARSELNAYDWPPPARPMKFASNQEAIKMLLDFEARPAAWLLKQQPEYDKAVRAHVQSVDTQAEYDRIAVCDPRSSAGQGPK